MVSAYFDCLIPEGLFKVWCATTHTTDMIFVKSFAQARFQQIWKHPCRRGPYTSSWILLTIISACRTLQDWFLCKTLSGKRDSCLNQIIALRTADERCWTERQVYIKTEQPILLLTELPMLLLKQVANIILQNRLKICQFGVATIFLATLVALHFTPVSD